METVNRRYDIDWLRVIAIGLLLIYHIAIVFQPWAVLIGFPQNDTSLESIWVPMSILNVWRIPLLFFVSGMGVSFAMRKRTLKQLFLERTRRILLPFLFGVFFIVPVHVFIWLKFYNQDLEYGPGQGHLWFLANIFIYVIVLSPIFYLIKKNSNSKIVQRLISLFKSPIALLVIAGVFVLESALVKPEIYTLYAFNIHGYILGFLAFLFGYLSILAGDGFWHNLLKWKWWLLFSSILLFTFRYVQFDMLAPNYLLAFESCLWVFTVFGFAFRYLNKPGKTLTYLSQGAYPIYITHMIFLYLGSMLILPLGIPTFFKLFLIIAFTGAGCFATYDLIIRRVKFLRPLFGLKS